jgi:hypothetical protein
MNVFVQNFESDFVLLEELSGTHDELIERHRSFRGRLLGQAFELEAALDELITEAFFPRLPAGSPPTAYESSQVTESKPLFEDLIAKQMQFGAKVDLLRQLVRYSSKLVPTLEEDLLEQIDACRDFRNRLAHYPIVFRLEGRTRRPYLRPLLNCRDKDVDLTDAYMKQQEQRFWRATRDIRQARVALRKKG